MRLIIITINNIEEIEIVNGTINDHNNELDAFRHSYVSGVYAMEYGKVVSELLGITNEIKGSNPPGERNMDDWNNAPGRDVITRNDINTKQDLLNGLAEEYKNGNMITDPNDKRDYHPATFHENLQSKTSLTKEQLKT